MELSIIIPTIRSTKNLNKLIRDIQVNIYDIKYEIIIIYQGVSGNIFSKNKKIKFIRTAKTGLSYAKNLGLKYAKYKICAFLDDDIKINKNYLKTGLNFFRNKTRVNLLFGKIKINNKDFTYHYPKRTSRVNYSNFLCCLASAMWINKRNKNIDNLFDKNFGLGSKYGSGEETDLVLRYLKNKKQIYFFSKNPIQHPPENDLSLNKIFMKYIKYGVGNGAIYRKNFKRSFFLIFIFFKSIIQSLILFLFYFIIFNFKKSFKYIALMLGKIKGFCIYGKS